MTGYLLDTNVISEVTKRRACPQVLERLERLRGEQLYTSVVSVMELRHGTARHPAGDALWERIEGELLSQLHVLPVGYREALLAGEVLAVLQSRGTPIGVEDLLIGVTALTHRLTVATRNVKHLSRVPGLEVECWWGDD